MILLRLHSCVWWQVQWNLAIRLILIKKHEAAIEEANDEDEIDEGSDKMIPSHGDLNFGLGPLTFAEEGEEEVLTRIWKLTFVNSRMEIYRKVESWSCPNRAGKKFDFASGFDCSFLYWSVWQILIISDQSFVCPMQAGCTRPYIDSCLLKKYVHYNTVY